jgi:anti-sigma factor RsiW
VNLDLGGPGPGCSSMRVRRLLAGELTGVEKERTEAHLASCPRCAAVQEEIAAEREALRRDVPFPQFAASVAEKLAHRPRRSFGARWAPLAAAAGLALIAGTLLVRRPAETERERSKGGGSVQLFAQDERGVHELAPGERIGKGARLLLSLQPAGRKRAAAVLIEPAETSVIYEGPAVKGALPQAFEWTGSGVATLLVVLSDTKVDASTLRSPADAPSGADVLQIQLRR